MDPRCLLPFLAIPLLAAAPAVAQTGSVDLQGPMVLTPLLDGFFGTPIGAADILTTTLPGPPGPNPLGPGPLPPPGIEVGGAPGAIGVIPGGLGLLPGFCGLTELDALSYGRDVGTTLAFSVDEFAVGVPGAIPDVFSEGFGGGLAEASADAFSFLGPLLPFPPGPPIGNTAIADGDGLVPSGAPGGGLIEPNPPSPSIFPDAGDNLDAFDADTTFADLSGLIYFSLDSGFPDLLEVPGLNCGTAPANGFSGADVLLTAAGAGGPVVAIPGNILGLDLAGFDTDDLDALAFNDADGSGSLTAVDTIYFSVRRGSAVIGVPDSGFGVSIEEGDVLIPPPVPGLPPAIFIAAEALGLATLRSGTAGPFGSDDLDALDVFTPPPPPAVPALGAWGQGALVVLLLGAPLVTARLRHPRRA